MLVQINKLPELLTVRQMAKILKMEKASAYRIIYEKNFPILKIGPNEIRIPKREFMTWVRANTKEYNRQEVV